MRLALYAWFDRWKTFPQNFMWNVTFRSIHTGLLANQPAVDSLTYGMFPIFHACAEALKIWIFRLNQPDESQACRWKLICQQTAVFTLAHFECGRKFDTAIKSGFQVITKIAVRLNPTNNDSINYYLRTVVVCLLHWDEFFFSRFSSFFLECIATIKQKLSSEQKAAVNNIKPNTSCLWG